MNSKQKRAQKARRMKYLTHLRYAWPVFGAVLILLSLAVPCLQYTTNQTGTEEPISGFALMANAWNEVRACLFGGAQQTNMNLIFSRTVLILLIVFWVLFVFGFAVSVWVWLLWLRYEKTKRNESSEFLWFATLIPNRPVLCILQGLVLPLSVFPYLLSHLYRSMLYVAVDLKSLFLNPLWIGLLTVVGTAVFSCCTAAYEKKSGKNLFGAFKRKENASANGAELSEQEKASGASAAQSREEASAALAKREQAERIARALLRENVEADDRQEEKD